MIRPFGEAAIAQCQDASEKVQDLLVKRRVSRRREMDLLDGANAC